MLFSKSYFDRVFECENPWGNCCEFEQVKYERQIEALKQHAPAPTKILEIGSGEGNWTIMLAEAFPAANIQCVEISPRALERAKRNLDGRNNIRFIEGDIVDLLVKDYLTPNTFDVIVQSESLYYLFPKLASQIKVHTYVKQLVATMSMNGIFLTANGINPVVRCVINTYYLFLGRTCSPEYSAQFKEWNEFRKKACRYELKVFRKIKD